MSQSECVEYLWKEGNCLQIFEASLFCIHTQLKGLFFLFLFYYLFIYFFFFIYLKIPLHYVLPVPTRHNFYQFSVSSVCQKLFFMRGSWTCIHGEIFLPAFLKLFQLVPRKSTRSCRYRLFEDDHICSNPFCCATSFLKPMYSHLPVDSLSLSLYLCLSLPC